MRKIITILILFFVNLVAQAQNITFTIPDEANKSFVFIVPNGLNSDTIAVGKINIAGMGKIAIPQKYNNISAIGMLKIDNGPSTYLILENNDFSFRLAEGDKLIFSGSEENDLFYNRQEELLDKKYESTYAQFFVKTNEVIRKMSKVLSNQQQASLFDKTSARLSALNDVDIDKLYYSRFWYFVIDGLLKLSSNEEQFVDDMTKLLDKTKTDLVYTALLNDLIMMTYQFGMDDSFDKIVLHAKDSGRIEYPQGIVYDAFEMVKVRKGTQAPSLVGLSEFNRIEKTKALFIFYQPGCENCHEQLALLNDNYHFFKEHNVEIISISSDTEEKLFKNQSEKFLWEKKLCDFKGFAGENFRNYGVMATPVLYLLDEKNVISGRFATVEKVKSHLINEF